MSGTTKSIQINSCGGYYHQEDIFQFRASFLPLVCEAVFVNSLESSGQCQRTIWIMNQKNRDGYTQWHQNTFFKKNAVGRQFPKGRSSVFFMSQRLVSELERLAPALSGCWLMRKTTKIMWTCGLRGGSGPLSWRLHFLWDLGFHWELIFDICKVESWTKLPLNSVFYRSYFYAFDHYTELILLAFFKLWKRVPCY